MPSRLQPFSGRLAAKIDKPVAWEGAPPARLLLLAFATQDQAQAWKASDDYKSFLADLKKLSVPTIEPVQGLAVSVGGGPSGRGHGRHAGFDMKAFTPYVERNDQLLKKLDGICNGC